LERHGVRIFREIIVGLLMLVLAACVAGFWFVAFKGKPLLVKELRRLTGHEVTVATVRPVFPAGLKLTGFKIETLLDAPRVVVFVDPLALVGGKVRLMLVELEAPQINIDAAKLSGEPEDATDNTGVASSASAVSVSENAGERVTLGVLKVRGASVMFQHPSAGRTWILEHVDAELRHIPLDGQPLRTDIIVAASLEKMNVPFVGHLLKIRGWANWPRRDMQVLLEALDDAGRPGLSANAVSRNNEMVVSGKARLSLGQQKQSSGKKSRMVEDVVLGLLEASGTEVESEFSFKTRMDRPEIGAVALKGVITTQLNSSGTSVNIVGALKAAGKEMIAPAPVEASGIAPEQ
jgi:hypothetical protein